MDFGYARVSTKQAKGRKAQHVDNQVERLEATGIDREHIYTDDGVSGRKASARRGISCSAKLRKGDRLTVTSMTRIGRSLQNLLDIMTEFDRRGVDVIFLDQNIDTSTAQGRLVFHVMAALSEYEADLTRQRVLEGLEAARDRHGGALPVRGRRSPRSSGRTLRSLPGRPTSRRPASRRWSASAGPRSTATWTSRRSARRRDHERAR